MNLEVYRKIVAKVYRRTWCFGDEISQALHKLLDEEFKGISELEGLELLEMEKGLSDYGQNALNAMRREKRCRKRKILSVGAVTSLKRLKT